MSEFRDALSELETAISKEAARLSRPISIDARSELVFRVWPFLRELIDTLELLDQDEPPLVPVDLVARTVGLLIGMLNQLGQSIADEQLAQLATHVHEVADELIALVDADELAEYVAAATQPPATATATAPPKVIEAAPIQDATVVEVPAEPPKVPEAA